jgi:hypothetical protein
MYACVIQWGLPGFQTSQKTINVRIWRDFIDHWVFYRWKRLNSKKGVVQDHFEWRLNQYICLISHYQHDPCNLWQHNPMTLITLDVAMTLATTWRLWSSLFASENETPPLVLTTIKSKLLRWSWFWWRGRISQFI